MSYDASTRTATVKPMQKTVLRDGSGEREAHELAPIHAVPVVWPGQVDLVAGDGVLLVFCDYDLGSWRDGGASAADPGDETTHGPSGAVAIPGLDTVQRKAAEVSQYVALSNLVTAQLNTLKNAISGAAVVAGDGGAAFKANLVAALSAWPSTVASSKVRVNQ